MKINLLRTIGLACMALVMIACENNTDVADSGIYQGVVKEVEADNKEIIVVSEDEKTLELRFTDATTLTKADKSVDFSDLHEGQKVEVEVVNVGGSLNPVSVRILE